MLFKTLIKLNILVFFDVLPNVFPNTVSPIILLPAVSNNCLLLNTCECVLKTNSSFPVSRGNVIVLSATNEFTAKL